MSFTFELPPKVRQVTETLEKRGYHACVVGGCVRDALLGKTPKDWDITTSARPEEVKACFRRTVDTGERHGTVTVMLGEEGFEVTTWRRGNGGDESERGSPEKGNVFVSSLREDLGHRDFTVNAMAYHARGGLIDYFGGREDLRAGILRGTCDPAARFREDPLRVMRAVRFAAVYGFEIEARTAGAMRAYAARLRAVSAERIREEMMKTVTSPHPELFRLFCEMGMTAVFLPELDACMDTPRNDSCSVGEHLIRAMCAAEPDPVLRTAALLHDIAEPVMRRTDPECRESSRGRAEKSAETADAVLKRLRFDNGTRKRAVHLIRRQYLRPEPVARDVRSAAASAGPEYFRDCLKLWAADIAAGNGCAAEEKARHAAVRELYEKIAADGDCLTVGDLAVNGSDLIALGAHGKQVGEILTRLLEAVLEDPGKNSRETLLSMAHDDRNTRQFLDRGAVTAYNKNM